MIKKKIVLIALAAGIIVGPYSLAFADVNADDQSGTVTVADTNGGGNGISVDLSPGVIMSYYSADDEYAFTTTNTNADTDNRLEYAIYSGTTGYYQATNDNTADETEWDSADPDGSDPFDNDSWTYMGSSSSGT
ncbi:hypothetical protein GF1_20110 [Desulfolithobacter dissulfuricans]|uniref:Uncharacterized protein n=1 Tax=Desulfolithobacter dissulfuricans TaxID=2795293 RepID=A0A915UAJ7_9BACT|nr:hypothetical protein [Desulfolithobacter dissulfuricans]BCO09635.1 hypothetical protein GF1_20110 [Desulfolithobacter dissulfuricans]